MYMLYVLLYILCRFGLDYIDLYLMHSAMGGKTVETWDAMVELKELGLIRCSVIIIVYRAGPSHAQCREFGEDPLLCFPSRSLFLHCVREGPAR